MDQWTHVTRVQPLFGNASESPVPAILALAFGLLGRLFTARWRLFVVLGKVTEVAVIIEFVHVISQLS